MFICVVYFWFCTKNATKFGIVFCIAFVFCIFCIYLHFDLFCGMQIIYRELFAIYANTFSTF